LKYNPYARGDDEYLIKITKKYCQSHDLKIPASETITRCRRRIQNNEGLFLASDEVQRKRKEREKQFSELFKKE
jgi:hypothetical protein